MDLMNCVDATNALNALIGVTLIASAGALMMNKHTATLGSFALALGYLILALAIVDRDISALRDPLRAMSSPHTLVALGSAVAIVSGKLLMYYHVQDLLSKYDSRVVKELVKDLPMIYNVLIAAGALGLVYSLAMSGKGVNYVRGALGLAAVAAVYYSNHLMVKNIGEEEQKVLNSRNLHLLSYLLMIVAVGYAC